MLLISLCVHLVDCEFYMCSIGINSTDNLAKCGVPLLSTWLRSFQPIFETSSSLCDCNSVCMNCYVSWGLYDSLDILYRNCKKDLLCWSGLGKEFLRNQEIRFKDFVLTASENLSKVSIYKRGSEDLQVLPRIFKIFFYLCFPPSSNLKTKSGEQDSGK